MFIIASHISVFWYYIHTQSLEARSTDSFSYYSLHNFEYDNITSLMKETAAATSAAATSSISATNGGGCGGAPLAHGTTTTTTSMPSFIENAVNYVLEPMVPMFSKYHEVKEEEKALGFIDKNGNVIPPPLAAPVEIASRWLINRCDVVKSFRLIILGPIQEEMIFRAVVFHLIVNRLPSVRFSSVFFHFNFIDFNCIEASFLP